MRRSFFVLLLTGLALTGCGIKGPLYLPPDPNDSYLSRIEQELNDMTGGDTASEAPEPEEQIWIEEKLPSKSTTSEESAEETEKTDNSGADNASKEK